MGCRSTSTSCESSGILSPSGVVRARHQVGSRYDDDVSVGDAGRHRLRRRGGRAARGAVARRGVRRACARHLGAGGGTAAARPGGRRRAAAGRPGHPDLRRVARGHRHAGRPAGRRPRRPHRRPRACVSGSRVRAGRLRRRESERADAVVLATPAAPTARLLADLAPAASAELAEPRVRLGGGRHVRLRPRRPARRGRGGVRVPGRRPSTAGRSRRRRSASPSGAWVRPADDGLVLLRTSLGRDGEERTLQRTDAELVAASLGRPPRRGRPHRRPGRHPRAALGRRAAAVRRGPPRPGRADPRRRRRRARPRGLRSGVRRRRDRRLHRQRAPRRGVRAADRSRLQQLPEPRRCRSRAHG